MQNPQLLAALQVSTVMLMVFRFGIVSTVDMTLIRSSNNSVGFNRLVNDDKKGCDDDNDESDDDVDCGT